MSRRVAQWAVHRANVLTRRLDVPFKLEANTAPMSDLSILASWFDFALATAPGAAALAFIFAFTFGVICSFWVRRERNPPEPRWLLALGPVSWRGLWGPTHEVDELPPHGVNYAERRILSSMRNIALAMLLSMVSLPTANSVSAATYTPIQRWCLIDGNPGYLFFVAPDGTLYAPDGTLYHNGWTVEDVLKDDEEVGDIGLCAKLEELNNESGLSSEGAALPAPRGDRLDKEP